MTLRAWGGWASQTPSPSRSWQFLEEPTLSSSVPTQGRGCGPPSTEDPALPSPAHDLCNPSLAGFLVTVEGDKGCQDSRTSSCSINGSSFLPSLFPSLSLLPSGPLAFSLPQVT